MIAQSLLLPTTTATNGFKSPLIGIILANAGASRRRAPRSCRTYGNVKRNELKIMWACAVEGVPGATYQGARVR